MKVLRKRTLVRFTAAIGILMLLLRVLLENTNDLHERFSATTDDSMRDSSINVPYDAEIQAKEHGNIDNGPMEFTRGAFPGSVHKNHEANSSAEETKLRLAQPIYELQQNYILHNSLLFPLCKTCNKHDFKYMFNNARICRTTSPHQKIDLFILILSSFDEVVRRSMQRKTWLSATRNNTANVRYAFIMGTTPNGHELANISIENNVHHDIIQETYIDNYYNLTHKVIGGLKWFDKYCSNADYFLKTDSDVFLNTEAILEVLRTNKEFLQRGMVGACKQETKPERDPLEKFYVSEKEYRNTTYPPYCMGVGYILSGGVVRAAHKISKNVPFFKFEDVYAGMLISVLGMGVRNVPGFSYAYQYRDTHDPCEIKANYSKTAHPIRPVIMGRIWRKKCNDVS